MTASCKRDQPCSGTQPAHPVLPANAGHPEDGVAPRAQAATATPRSDNATRAAAASSARSPAKQKPGPTENLRRAEHRDIGVSTNGNRIGSPGGYVRGEARDFRAFASSSANQDDPAIVDELA